MQQGQIGRCQFEQPTDDGSERCEYLGNRLRLNDCLGHTMIRYLCIYHTDNIECPEQQEQKT